jgi:hypothetical protein
MVNILTKNEKKTPHLCGAGGYITRLTNGGESSHNYRLTDLLLLAARGA